MQLTHPDYTKLVYGTYKQLCSTPEFSPDLKQPTPKSISNECLIVYKERPHKKDEPVLRSFFGPPAENNSFLKTIEKFPTERFKALANYLKKKAVKTDDKNLELLAWLIDFPHRPFRHRMDIILSEAEKAILNNYVADNPPQWPDRNFADEIEDESFDKSPDNLGEPLENELKRIATSKTEEPVPAFPISQPSNKIKTENKKRLGWGKFFQENKKMLLVGIALFFTIATIGVYQFFYKEGDCMYWNVDHYERIDCNAEVTDKVVFNKERLKNFRKITDFPIPEKMIGVAFYSGNKNREFFTCWGKHPVDPTRNLRVMTRHVWEKEFGRKDSVAKDSSADQSKKLLATNPKK